MCRVAFNDFINDECLDQDSEERIEAICELYRKLGAAEGLEVAEGIFGVDDET